jgi:general secretion pathway protein G
MSRNSEKPDFPTRTNLHIKSPPDHRAFTLVELVVTVAIVATLAAIAVPVTKDYLYKAQVTRAIAEIRTMEKEIAAFMTAHGDDTYPNSLADIQRADLLDPWGKPYQYLNIAASLRNGHGHPTGARKDRHLVPLNSDYDLYSVGRDGESKAPLQNPESYDDVIRANDGQYVGLASGY